MKNKFLNILYELSKSADIAVKTPVGITEEEELESRLQTKADRRDPEEGEFFAQAKARLVFDNWAREISKKIRKY